MEFDLENPLTVSEEEDTNPVPFLVESHQMASINFFNRLKTDDFLMSLRREAIFVASQAYYSGNFDTSVLYLAVNYMDRFILARPNFPLGKPWIWRLLIVACVSLAAKMKDTECSLLDFQKEDGLIFTTQTIQRMELTILDALNWRMRSITPFAFIHFFISRFKHEGPPLMQTLKDRAICIIFKSQKEINLLEFKPSTIAAAAILVASHELLSCERSVFSCEYVDKDNVLRCLNAIDEAIEMEGCESMMNETEAMSTRASSNVLDWRCSTESEKETKAVTPEKRKIKRRRINHQCNDESTVRF